jgi:hypothetical protein
MTRAVAVAVLAVLVVLAWAGMYAGWRRRGARQTRELGVPSLPPPPATPVEAGTPLTADADGVYVSSTTAGDWLDRVTASGLGARSAATMAVSTAGVTWFRQGAPDVFAAAGSVLGARRVDGIAGKVVPPHGIVVVTWRLGDVELDTGFRPRTPGDGDRIVAAVERLAATTRAGGVS